MRNEFDEHQIEGLVDNKIRSHSGYSANDWRLSAEQIEKRSSRDQLNTDPTLIVTLLLSLALWAAIWGVVSSFISAASG